MAASREEIDLVVNALTKGFDALDSDLKQTGDSFGKMALKQQLAAEKSKLFDAQMKELSAAVQKGTISMDEAGNRAEELARSLKLVDNASKDTTEAVQSQKLSWTDLKSAIDLGIQVYQKVAQVAKFAYDTIKEGAQLNLAADRFDNLTESIGTTSESMLTDLRTATKGMQSDAQLIAGATDIISLGLSDTQEGTVRLATAVSTLGLDMQQVILTFANNSKARLDALGLSIEDVDAKTQELEANGFQGDAFDEAVLIALEEKMTLLGDASQKAAGQLQILESEWTNMTNALKEGAAEIAGPLISALTSDLQTQKQLTSAYQNGVITYKEWLSLSRQSRQEGGLNAETNKEYAAAVEGLNSLLAKQTGEMAKVNQATLGVAAADAVLLTHINDLTKAEEARINSIINYSAAAAEAAGINENLSDKTAQLAAHTGTEEQAAKAANLANEQYFKTLAEGAAAAEAAAQAAAEQAASMGDLFRQAIDTDGAIGLFNETSAQMADRTIYVSDLTGDQRTALSDLQAEYEKAQGIINDYTIGAKGVGMETEAVNEKVAEQQERMAELQAAMEPLLAVGGEFAAVQGTTTLNQEALNQAIFDAADAQGASAEQLAILGGALGLYSEDALNAALQSALIQAKIQELTAQYLAGDISVQQMKDSIYAFAESLNTIPGSVTTDVQVTGVDEAIGKVGSLQAQLSALGGQVSAAEAAGAVQKPGGGVGLAGGADFVVPPGYPNDSFGPIYLQSGEHVQVTPPGQSGGGRSGMVQNNYFNNASNPEATATAVANKLGNLR